MDSSDTRELIDSKYIIKEKIGSDNSSNIFLVKDKEKNQLYVAKVFKEENKYEREVNILNILEEKNIPNIQNIIDYGEGEIIRKKRKPIKRGYYILEYAPNPNLFDNIYYKKSGLGEIDSKVIFFKIMKGIQSLHANNICHRNLLLENILLDKDFCPKISDFGFACINSPNLGDNLGPFIAKPSEINEEKQYDGIKADIFSLGVLLFTLTVGSPGFKSATNEDKFYQKIKNRELDEYWTIVDGTNLSNDFKDLYAKMVSYDPNQRPSAEDILKHDWFKEINEINLDREKKIKEMFMNFSLIIKDNNQKEMVAIDIPIDSKPYNTRSYDDDYDKFFHYNYKPKDLNTPMNINNTIKIKGYLDPCYFMNSLCQYMMNKFGIDNCFLEADEEKFKIILTLEEGNDEEMKEDEEYIETTLEIKLYKYSDGHLLRFIQKEGNRKQFLDKFEIISKLVKDLVC